MSEIKEPIEVWTIKPKPKTQEPPLPEIIYVAGKITGERVMHCVTKFYAAKCKLRMIMPKGTIIRTPFDLPGIFFGIEHEAAMKICLDFVENHCTGIYMLNDWTDSPGAKRELSKAIECNKRIRYENAPDIYKKINR